jgi:RNA polymerase sigma-70 factor, ECF subfamily
MTTPALSQLPTLRLGRKDSRELHAEHLPDQLDRLYRLARTITGSAHDAEDLVSETMVRVLARPRRIRHENDLAYLARCLRNTWTDTLRARSRRPVTAHMPEDMDHEDVLAARRPQSSAEARAVLEAVARLPESYRAAVLLVDVVGLTYSEAAAELGVPRGTIMSRVSRGRAAVIAEFEPAEPLAA